MDNVFTSGTHASVKCACGENFVVWRELRGRIKCPSCGNQTKASSKLPGAPKRATERRYA